jgi:hypothetical protein
MFIDGYTRYGDECPDNCQQATNILKKESVIKIFRQHWGLNMLKGGSVGILYIAKYLFM